MAEESPDNQMMRLAQNELFFDRFIPMQSVIDQIDAVAADDLLTLANERWGEGRPALTVLGLRADRMDLSGLIDF
jgi:hypothetical protein